MQQEATIHADVETIARLEVVPTILQTLVHTTGMRFVAVARVTETNWIACAVHDEASIGLQPGGEMLLETTLCNEIRASGEPLLVPQASAHPVFANHPGPRLYGFESYIAVPIVQADGRLFGTLCALDPEPSRFEGPAVLQTMQLFAQLIAAQLDAQERMAVGDAELAAAREVATLREQFIAVLGHDLRNPLQAIDMAAELIQLGSPEPRLARNVQRIRQSVERMVDMIDNLLDFARGRLGGGIPLSVVAEPELAPALEHVVTEIRIAYPQRNLEASIELRAPVACDAARIGQLMDNLLANAMRHGTGDQPVRVRASSGEGRFELSVHNSGVAIPPEKMARLFQPFSRTLEDEPGPGLGLGLYIAAEIAKAHGGTLRATSSPESGTEFIFAMRT